ncbi:hypothetical protein LP52_14450 [Streptomonospora alba]|uniref:DUF4233 domain-containing protein n=1 Tax=Streptomonospora alba TaxID=183763 RepID=A0A0C2JMU5_9ACTN|nr:DUF4233 domain-containing protein [Streptomonospora alba]KIH98142.1 hypothetical protein LP52_14450 [Streptomonospora alba]
MRRMCAVVLLLECMVIGLAVPVAIQVAGIDPAVAGSVWGGLAGLALLLSALQRFRPAYYAGWALQAAFLISGFVVPGLALLGVVFLALWVAAVLLGQRTDAQDAARAETRDPQPGQPE